MSELNELRSEIRGWLKENCPPGARGEGQTPTGSTKIEIEDPDVRLWLDRAAEKGYTVPNWPVEYGGAGMNTAEYVVLVEEMRRIEARAPLIAKLSQTTPRRSLSSTTPNSRSGPSLRGRTDSLALPGGLTRITRCAVFSFSDAV